MLRARGVTKKATRCGGAEYAAEGTEGKGTRHRATRSNATHLQESPGAPLRWRRGAGLHTPPHSPKLSDFYLLATFGLVDLLRGDDQHAVLHLRGDRVQ